MKSGNCHARWEKALAASTTPEKRGQWCRGMSKPHAFGHSCRIPQPGRGTTSPYTGLGRMTFMAVITQTTDNPNKSLAEKYVSNLRHRCLNQHYWVMLLSWLWKVSPNVFCLENKTEPRPSLEVIAMGVMPLLTDRECSQEAGALCAFHVLWDSDFQLPPRSCPRPQGRLRRKEFFLRLKLFHLTKEKKHLTEVGKHALDLCPPLGWWELSFSVPI